MNLKTNGTTKLTREGAPRCHNNDKKTGFCTHLNDDVSLIYFRAYENRHINSRTVILIWNLLYK